MPKKPDLATALGQRRKQNEPAAATAEPVVPQNALAEAERVLRPATADKTASSTEKRVPVQARTPRTPARIKETTTGGITIEDLYRRLMQKKHLSSYTLRFRAEELDDLDAVAKEIEEKADGTISKNDIARAALIWLLEDYHQRGKQSVLEQIANRG